VSQRTVDFGSTCHAAPMENKDQGWWKAFSVLAREYPGCEAVKLTIELQRRFIHHRRRLVVEGIHALLAKIDGGATKGISTTALPGDAGFEFKRDIAKFH
jgi:hypothetical protein